MRGVCLVLISILGACLCAVASAGLPREKLYGPVADFLRSAKARHIPYVVDSTKNVGFLYWAGDDQSPPLVIVPGRGEVAAVWTETVYDLVQMGHTGPVYIWDPPGQGLSDRMLPELHDVTHIERFQDYVVSLIDFLKLVREESGRTPKMVAHSMGGAISLLALRSERELAEKLVLVSPMLDIRYGPPGLNKLLAFVVTGLDRLPFMRTFVLRRMPAPGFANDLSLTQRLEFREWIKIQFNSDMPGTTLHWVAEAQRSINSLFSTEEGIDIPALFLVAGNDDIVKAKGSFAFQKRCRDLCQVEVIEKVRHSMYEEREAVRGRILNRVASWLGIARMRGL